MEEIMDRVQAKPTVINEWFDAPENERVDTVRDYLTELVGSRLIEKSLIDNIDEFDPEMSLIGLGIESITALELKGAIEKELGMRLSSALFFDYPSVNVLANHLSKDIFPHINSEAQLNNYRDDSASIADMGLGTIIPEPSKRYEPFSLQNLVSSYFMNRISSFELSVRSHDYFENDLENLDIQKFEQAWNRLVKHHEMLHAIVLPDGQYQILKEVPYYRISTIDLRGSEAAEAESKLLSIRSQMEKRQYRPDQWPLFELRVTLLDGIISRLHFDCDLLILDYNTYHILNRDLERLYQGEELDPIGLSYRDYMVALEKLAGSNRFSAEKDYWFSRIDSLPPSPDLPLKSPLASIKQHPGFELVDAHVDRETWQRVRENMQANGVQVSAGMASIFSEVLALYSNSRHFTLNLMFFNRLDLHPDVYEIAGNMASTFLLEVDLRGERSIKENSQNLQRQILADIANTKVTTGLQVMQELNRRRGSFGTAPFPVAFSSTFVHQLSTGRFLKPVSSSSHYNKLETPATYLDHLVGENEDGSLFIFWYLVKDLFEDGLIERMMKTYVNFIRKLANASAWNEPYSHLLLDEELESRKRANSTANEMQRSGLLQSPFLEQVNLQPQKTAIVSGERILSYAELFHRSNQLAHELRGNGCRHNEIVAIVMKKGWEQIVAAYAILLAGGAYVPIDAELPEERIAYILENANVRFALTQSSVQNRLQGISAIQSLSVDEKSGFERYKDMLISVQQQNDLAYVIYTSGSTGKPKGVMISHRAAFNTIEDCNRRFNVGSDDVFLAVSQLSFDLSVYDIFGGLGAGATLVLPEDDKRTNPDHWLALMQERGVTIWNSAPPLMVMLTEYAAMRADLSIGALRLVMLSGDWIPVALPERIASLAPNAEMMSLGGATEAAIWSIIYPIEDVAPGRKSIPYGKPMVNQTFHVLNNALQPCPVWVAGELFIGGCGLAEGYLNDPEKTATHFFIHPAIGERLYRTGDKGRYLPDGNIEFLGRVDFQVKIQGYRIELGEIEAALNSHPSVKDSLVLAVGEKQAEKQLAAYVLFKHESVTDEIITAYLRTKLPIYMVPKHILFLDSFPITDNGKVDRRALPPVVNVADTIDSSYVAPTDATEKKLVELWEDLLGRKPIGVTDNFFELGGQSFLAVRMIARIHKLFGKALPLSVLFEKATIAHLSKCLVNDNAEAGSVLVPIQKEGNKPPVFFVHPVGGNVFCYTELARLLGQDQPFYGFQSNGLSGSNLPSETFEDMASLYIEKMRQVQPHGPYRLGGWSLGGSVAFEMAKQLHDFGEKVEWLGMIDSPAPVDLAALDDGELLAWFATDLTGHEPRISLKQLSGFTAKQQVEFVWEHAVKHHILPEDSDCNQLAALFNVFKANMAAQIHYSQHAMRFEGPRITLFKAVGEPTQVFKQHYPAYLHPAFGWDRLTSNITVVAVAGDHYTALTEGNVATLAQAIGAELAEGIAWS